MRVVMRRNLASAGRRAARRPVRTAAVAVAAIGMLALSGCGLRPGVAAEVGDRTITKEQVEDVASALCAANLTPGPGGQAPQLPSSGARAGALQVLLDAELARQFGEAEGVEADQAQVAAALAQNEPGIAALPEDRQDAFRDALRAYTEGQLMLIEAGRRSLRSGGTTEVTDDDAFAEGRRLQLAYVEGLDIEVDPRFGEFDEGQLVPGSPSLSVAQSEFAVAAGSGQPDQSFVAQLPTTQLCS